MYSVMQGMLTRSSSRVCTQNNQSCLSPETTTNNGLNKRLVGVWANQARQTDKRRMLELRFVNSYSKLVLGDERDLSHVCTHGRTF